MSREHELDYLAAVVVACAGGEQGLTVTLTPDEVEVVLCALDGEIGIAADNVRMWEGREHRQKRYQQVMDDATAVRAKIEAAAAAGRTM